MSRHAAGIICPQKRGCSGKKCAGDQAAAVCVDADKCHPGPPPIFCSTWDRWLVLLVTTPGFQSNNSARLPIVNCGTAATRGGGFTDLQETNITHE